MPTPKRNLLYAFDGTWNKKKDGEDSKSKNTNVVRFHDAYEKNTGNKQFYVSGVGTRHHVIGAVLGGTFGLGVLDRLDEGYKNLCQAWIDNDGNIEIDIIGFSRGAAIALDFTNLILKKGIRHPTTGEQLSEAPQIRFLGLWDVVAAFGLANLGNTVLNFGHHLSLPHKNLKYCFHAMALDERRLSFLPTRLPGACEVWFRGVHSDIGGGNGNRPLNDFTMRWMMRKAMAAGLPIVQADVDALKPSMVDPHDNKLPLPVRVVAGIDRQHYSVTPLKGFTTPPATCPVETETDEGTAGELGAGGIELLPGPVRNRISAIWEAAQDRAQRLGCEIKDEDTTEWIMTLIEGRVGLVQTPEDLQRARASIETLITAAVNAQPKPVIKVDAFFLNQALFNMPHLFPLSD
jgi:type VI secretion system (T6SS) phospholipase Tle1-like effector